MSSAGARPTAERCRAAPRRASTWRPAASPVSTATETACPARACAGRPRRRARAPLGSCRPRVVSCALGSGRETDVTRVSRRIWLAGLAALLGLGAGCATNKPLDLPKETLAINMNAAIDDAIRSEVEADLEALFDAEPEIF
ncbi:MAG: YnbE family lipoprotein [Deltaproteobacteria bacterium]|nr:YnbE family lipoprotein [Deltaproteobacteria bacterium]